ncbi:MAG TPA: PAS domain S-box protein, partial [Phototrophicaceae bacterium]|nr:PAS domain S-box protein [Phototrophicaceae bacterium]
SITAMPDVNGQPSGYLAMVTDITDRKQVEAALHEANAYNRSLIEVSLDPLITIAPDGRITDVNVATEIITGYSRQHLIGTNVSNYFTVPDRVHASNQRAFDEGAVRDYELEIRNRNGRTKSVLYNAAVYRDEEGLIQGIFAAARDITDRKLIEHALRQSEERFRAIFESSVLGIALTNLSGGELQANPAFQKMLGYSAEELYRMDYTQITHPDDLAAEQGLVARLQTEERQSYQFEKRYRRRDGSVFWVYLTCSLIYDEAGKPVNMLGMVEDITDRKLMEARALELAAERGRMMVLASFIRDTGHEFRTPLSIINTSLYLLERTPDPSLRREQVLKIEQQVANIASLVDSLLMMSRLDSEINLHTEAVVISNLVQLAEATLSAAIQEKGLTIHREFAADLPPTAADPEKLGLALTHILGNAVRYTPPGGHITLKTDQRQRQVVVTIQDTGTGIKPESLAYIFDTFFREDSSHSTPGFGLGLPIAKKIINQHGGTIEVESELGKGSIFRVILPIAEND